MAQLGLKVYKRISDDEREHAGDHPAAKALRWPNPWTPGQQFIKDFVLDFLIYDNAYALKFPADNGELTLVSIPPHMVGITGNSFYQPTGYKVYDQDGNALLVPVERMVHWRGKNPNDPRRGESKLETLREELASDVANRQAVTEIYRSGMLGPAWVERPVEAPEWTDEAMKRFQTQLATMQQKSRREVPVMEEGMVLKHGGITPEDGELIAARRWTAEQVAGLFGMKNVPPESEEERYQFYADGLAPLVEMCAAFLDLHVLIREYNAQDHYFEFNLDEKLMGDDRLKALTSAAGAPILTRNEARARLNLPAQDDADELITPANVLVGANPKPSPQLMPIQNPNGPDQGGGFRSGQADQPAAAGSRAGLGHGRLWGADTNGNGSKALLLPRRAAKDRRRNEAADEFQAAIGKFITHMERSLKSRGMDAKAVADDRWERALAGELRRVGYASVKREGEITAARLATTFDADRTKAYIHTVAEAKAAEIVRALRADIAGDDPNVDVFENARQNAAPRAGMTLATNLTGFATLEAGRQDPNAEQRFKTWIVTSGNSAHGEMDGESVPLGESFSNGTDGPPADHPGCQCLLEIDGGGHPAPVKSIQVAHPAPPAPPPPPVNITFAIAEGALQIDAKTAIEEGAIKATVNSEQPDIHVAPAEVTFQKGAITSPDVNVDATTTIAEGAFHAEPSDVNVTLPAHPDLHVTVEQGKTTKRIVRDEKGHITEVVEETKQAVRRDEDGRIEAIEEES